MADLNELKRELKDYMDTLQETSRGGKNKNDFLCQSQEKVYNFEKYVDNKEKIEPNFKGKRFDALYIHNDIIYCIEFKIEKCADIDKQEIDGKFLDSFEMLKYVFKALNLQIRDYQFNFYVVFRDAENFFARRKIGDKCSFALQSRLIYTKKTNFPQLTININTGCKSNFLQIYNQIFSIKC